MVMAAACFPEAQLRVQEELDRVVGMDRRKPLYPLVSVLLFYVTPPVPTWSDWDALPQLHAFMSEAFRWKPLAPLGKTAPHYRMNAIVTDCFERSSTPFIKRYHLGTILSPESASINLILIAERLLYPCWHDGARQPLVCRPIRVPKADC